MCLPLCTLKLAETVSRRSLLRSAGVALGAATLSPLVTHAAPPRHSFQSVIDLTHTLSPTFPTPWKDSISLEQISKLGPDKWNIFRWHLNEHIGTHLDAPLHCTDLDSADRIPVENLVGPLVVVDLREKVAKNPDAELTATDLHDWEKKHGRIPDGAIIAMNSGWDAYVHDTPKFLGLSADGSYHLPGFSLEAVRFLDQQRRVKGIATDTLNLDPGKAGDFPVHHYWLGRNKWGLENVANLGQLPEKGATIIVGSPKIAGATGGPSRVIALV